MGRSSSAARAHDVNVIVYQPGNEDTLIGLHDDGIPDGP